MITKISPHLTYYSSIIRKFNVRTMGIRRFDECQLGGFRRTRHTQQGNHQHKKYNSTHF